MGPDLINVVKVRVKDLIQPYFVIEGRNKKKPIRTFPGVNRLSVDNLIKDICQLKNLGVKAVLIFGVSRRKDPDGSDAYSESGVVQKAIKAIKQEIKNITVITDVCLCGYTTHGHCGILKAQNKVVFDNEKTRKILAKIALSHAQAGADLVAPSAMMTGQVEAIRQALDQNGFKNIGILAYSAKFASNFYGPFREALDSSPRFGDRRGYQLDYREADAALREIEQDIKEGASIVMVKPALSYLDIIYKAKQKFNVPLAAYNVSGEYSLTEIGAKKGIVDKRQVILEILTSIKRAGADLIITYWAKEVAGWLARNK